MYDNLFDELSEALAVAKAKADSGEDGSDLLYLDEKIADLYAKSLGVCSNKFHTYQEIQHDTNKLLDYLSGLSHSELELTSCENGLLLSTGVSRIAFKRVILALRGIDRLEKGF